jgi:hypothetical protein
MGRSQPDDIGHEPGMGLDDPKKRPLSVKGMLVVLMLVIGVVLLIFKLRDVAKLHDCIRSGRKDCASIGLPTEE